MTQDLQVQLKTTAVLDVPLQFYDKDFTFIVNGTEYRTSPIISDLISPYISQIRQTDPTLSSFTIRTESRGNFEHVLNLATFSTQSIPSDEIPFFSEVIEKLGNRSISIGNLPHDDLTNDNAVQLLQGHEKLPIFYSSQIESEIEYISSHFFELCDRFLDELKALSIDTIEKVVCNAKLKLASEDQLLKFINELYRRSSDYSILYDHVLFENIENETMSGFVDLFAKDDMSEETWRGLANRLKQTVINRQEMGERYAVKFKEFQSNREQNFDGIIKFLLAESNGNISEKVDITASSYQQICIRVTQYDTNSCYQSGNEQNSWICFDFKDNRIIPTNYQIKTYNYGPSNHHLKSWIVEGSNDKNDWKNLSTVNDCSYLNGQCLSHIFPVTNQNNNEFRYIRLTVTGPNWWNCYCLTINCIEFYGKLL